MPWPSPCFGYAQLNDHFWGFAVLTAVYLLNRQFKDAVQGVPLAIVTAGPVSLSHLRIWGCPAWAHIPASRRTKFQDRAIKGIFVGYGPRGRVPGLQPLHPPCSPGGQRPVSRDLA